MYDEIVVELIDATQKDLFFDGPTIMVQVLYAFNGASEDGPLIKWQMH